MRILSGVVRQLKHARKQAVREVKRLDAALAVLRTLGSLDGSFRGVRAGGKRRKPMSAAARRRIAAAQRARWAKWKAKRKRTA